MATSHRTLIRRLPPHGCPRHPEHINRHSLYLICGGLGALCILAACLLRRHTHSQATQSRRHGEPLPTAAAKTPAIATSLYVTPMANLLLLCSCQCYTERTIIYTFLHCIFAPALTGTPPSIWLPMGSHMPPLAHMELSVYLCGS